MLQLHNRAVALCAFAWLWLHAATASALAPSAPAGDIADLQVRMAAGELTAVALTQAYLDRIAAYDAGPQGLHALIELNPEALDIAAQLDGERAQGHVRGPLHGIPVVIKDNIDTADRMLTTAGSLALADSRPLDDAFLVKRLREAGAVILGKTNLSEWANFRSSRSSSGWSARGGQTENPWDPTRSACGSSSGSAVAVAAGFAVVAVGTETDGSIVCPSSITGIVGFKPTVGRVSRSGIVPISVSQDTAGPMARSVADAALLLDVLSGFDVADPAAGRWKDTPPEATAAGLDAASLAGKRIGVVRGMAGFDPRVDAVFDAALERLRASGAILVDPVALDLPDSVGDDEFTVLLYEFKAGLAQYLAGRDGGPRTLADLIAFNRGESRELEHFDQATMLAAEEKGPLTDPAYLHARERAQRMAGPQGIDAALQAQNLDALVAPTTGPAWVIDWVVGDHYSGGAASTPAAVAGYPHVTLPAGQVAGLPVGFSMFAGAGDDAALMRLAAAAEAALPAAPEPVLGPVAGKPD